MKHKMEENIASLTDQIQLLDAVSFFFCTYIILSNIVMRTHLTYVVAAQYVLIENKCLKETDHKIQPHFGMRDKGSMFLSAVFKNLIFLYSF